MPTPPWITRYQKAHPDVHRRAEKKYRSSFKGKAQRAKQRLTPRCRYGQCKAQAKVRGIAFALTLKQYLTFADQVCYYCGEQLNVVGLDRIDSSIGYTLNNVVSCCRNCNYAKRLLSADEFVHHCHKVVAHFVSKLSAGS
jgi:hypothetical protein